MGEREIERERAIEREGGKETHQDAHEARNSDSTRVCARERVCVCLCVCVCERERTNERKREEEREGEEERERERSTRIRTGRASCRRRADVCSRITLRWSRSWSNIAFKAHRLLYHSTLGSRVMNKKRRNIHARITLRPDFTASDT